MARRIRDEHGGLSIAMYAASTALKNKLSSTWLQLKSLRHKSKPMPAAAELCLLICCMFPDDSRIPIDDLATYLMGLKLFEDVDGMFAARGRVYDLISIINGLKYPNNVIDEKNKVTLTHEKDGPDDHHMDMLVGARDLAKLIPISSPLVFRLEIVKEKWPELNWCKDCYGLSLVLKKVNEHPANLECPKLALLFLQYKEDSQIIPVDFFKGMEQLRVLCLDAPSLPQSFDVLRNLRTLRLKLLKFDDMSSIGDLTNLEYLSISTSSLIDIPSEMGQLENLRLLDLRRMDIAYISPGVLSRMLKLEELYLPLSFKRWGCKVKEDGDYDKWGSGEEDDYDDERRINVSLDKINDMERINASLSEMASLSLNTLQIGLPKASMLPKKSSMFKNIQDFKILLPSNIKYQPFDRYPINELQLKGDALAIKESGICDLMSRTGDLSLTRVRNLKNVIFELQVTSFPELKKMIISECGELEYVIDRTGQHMLPEDTFLFLKLESLHLSMLPNLKNICHGRWTGVSCFPNLSEISIRFCHKLKYVFPLSILRRSLLKSVEILDCNEMEGIFYEDEEDDIPLKVCSIEKLAFYSLPRLICILINKDDTINNTKGSSATKKVVSNYTEGSSSTFDRSSVYFRGRYVFPKQVSVMTTTDVTNQMKMYIAFTSKLVRNWSQNLKRLKIAFCDVVQVVFWLEEDQATSEAFNSLEVLELHGLRNLVHIWLQIPPKLTAFNNLQLLVLSECCNSYLFSSRIASLLFKLQKLYISRCARMEKIIVEDDENKGKDGIVFPWLKVLELQHIPNLKIFSSGTSEFDLPLLETLKLNQCDKMKTFSYGLFRTPALDSVEINGSLYSLTGGLNSTVMRVTNPHIQIFNLADLKIATNDFSSQNLLGGFGFGKVYAGWIREASFSPSQISSQMQVAIKRMDSKTQQGFIEWQSEVEVLESYSHPNMVKLLGHCWEDKELLLVYEFIQGGCLDQYLYTTTPGIEPLSWDMRIKIAIGVARGLNFLHTSEKKVIHGNIKSSNILLDRDYNAKIIDFGYAIWERSDGDSHVTSMIEYTKRQFAPETTVKGPPRVIDPEYYKLGRVNVKSDVYSFGAVLLQLMTGSRAFDSSYGHEFMFESWRPILSQERELKKIMDSAMDGQFSSKAMLRMAELASKCTEYDHRRRPTMGEVLEELLQIDAMKKKDKD